MSNQPTQEQLRESIVPKSDQLNADDLLTGPMTVTITDVKQGDREQPIVVELEGQRPYKPCKTMRRVLIAVYGDTPTQWVGQRLTLFNDQSVMWAGVKVGGIRISHMSGLDEPKTFLLTMTRGKKTEVTIQPVADSAVEDFRKQIQSADTLVTLEAVGFILKQQPEPIRKALRPAYVARQKALQLDLDDLATTMPGGE